MFVPIITAGLLFIAFIPSLPYGYYQVLRWIVCAASCFGAFTALEKDKRGWVWVLSVFALLFNPIVPIHLSREIWQPIDLIGGIVFLCSTYIFRK